MFKCLVPGLQEPDRPGSRPTKVNTMGLLTAGMKSVKSEYIPTIPPPLTAASTHPELSCSCSC